MRITIAQGAFLPVPPLRGGAIEKIWFALGKEFARRGHHVTHVSRSFRGLPKHEVLEGVQHVRVTGFDAPKSLSLLKLLDLIYSIRVLSALTEADILVTNTFWLPILVRAQQFGKLYVHVGRYPKGQMRFYAHAARLHTVSQSIQEAIISEVPACSRLVKCIPYPLPEASASVADGHLHREKCLLYIGRIHPEKGIDLLIDAFKRIPVERISGWRLRIVGPSSADAGGGGPSYLRSLQQQAAPLGERVEWTKPTYDGAQLASYYQRAQLFVYPSLAERGETFGLAPLEAMSHGCPALVSNLACFREFVVDEENGFVFNHRASDPARILAEKLEALLSEPSRIDRIRAASLATTKRFSVDQIAGLFLRDFDLLLAS